MNQLNQDTAHFQWLLLLSAKNPSLRIVPLVDGEIINEEGPGRWFASWGKSFVDQILDVGDHVYILSDDEEELIEYEIEKLHDLDESLSESELEKIARDNVKKERWETVILVQINQYR